MFLKSLKKCSILLFFLAMVVAMASMFQLYGCVTPGITDDGPKRITEMTPKEKGAWFLGIYNAQDKDYRNMVIRPDLTNDQKKILREKKKIMIRIYPMIKTYNTYLDSGAVPTKIVEDQIIQLINDLTALAIPKPE